MKTILSISLISLALICTHARTVDDDSLYEALNSLGKESLIALNDVLARPESVSSLVLFMASGAAFHEKRTEDAGFLFYVARLRAQFDVALYPPIGTGGDSPMVLVGTLSQQIGDVVTPALVLDRNSFGRALVRVKKWHPKASSDYTPGWEYSKRGGMRSAETMFLNIKKKFLVTMEGILSLLRDDDYFEAFKIAQSYNLTVGEARPSKESFDAAMKKMKSIETAKKIHGFGSLAKE